MCVVRGATVRDGPEIAARRCGLTNDLRILAIDDEPSALHELAQLLLADPRVGEVISASSASTALHILSRQSIDAVFVDARLPNPDALELARLVQRFERPPALVFVSVDESSAVQAFEVRALDYLLKPVTGPRLAQALGRVARDQGVAPSDRAGQPDRSDAGSGDDVIVVNLPVGVGLRLLPRSAILYVQANGDYQRLFSTEGRFTLRARMMNLERRWSDHDFVRVHRRFLVNLRQAVAVSWSPSGTAFVAFSNGSKVPVARRHVPDLRRRLRL
jgi:DNA-binding LytR/AlgR family response regulator